MLPSGHRCRRMHGHGFTATAYAAAPADWAAFPGGEVAALKQRIAALERQVALSSKTSSRPPSSDGLKKPPAEKRTQSSRDKSDRKTGGQSGHKGKTLRQSATPDHIIHHYPEI